MFHSLAKVIILITSILRLCHCSQTLEVNAYFFYLIREATTPYTCGTVLMSYREYSLTNLGCFPPMSIIFFLLT